VLLGRGKRAIQWAGNVRLRSLVKMWAREYDCSIDPQIRDTIANRVIAAIREAGGRFLQQQEPADYYDRMHQPTPWIVIPETSVRTKVKQALRDAAKKMTRTRKQQPSISSSMADAVAYDAQRMRSRSVDLEPRPIEEIMRTSSDTMIYSLSSFGAMLKQPPALFAAPAAAPVGTERRRLPCGSLQDEVDPSEKISYFPAAPSLTTLASDFFSPRRQQGIPSCRLTTEPNHDVESRLMFQGDTRGPATAVPPVEQITMNVASTTPDRLRSEHLEVSDSPWHSSSSNYMMGRTTATALPPNQRHSTTVLIDTTIHEQLEVDQRNLLGSDDHSTFDSLLFEEPETPSSPSGDDDDPCIEGSGVPPLRQHESQGRSRKDDA
jgi:hypothetical protein